MNWEKATDSVLDMTMATFGAPAVSHTYTPDGGAPSPIRGIFSNEYVAVDSGQGVTSSLTAPRLGVRLSELPCVPKPGDKVTVSGVEYKIINSEEDGQGGSTLILQNA